MLQEILCTLLMSLRVFSAMSIAGSSRSILCRCSPSLYHKSGVRGLQLETAEPFMRPHFLPRMEC